MTRVCLIAAEDVALPADLLAYETARDALSTYERRTPWADTLSVETVSLGAAISLLNDLDWYLARLVEAAIVLEPSVSRDEWLSRDLATAIRNDRIAPEETGTLLKIYGVTTNGKAERAGTDGSGNDAAADRETGDPEAADREAGAHEAGADGMEREPTRRLTEPLYAQRITDEVPDYDLHEVDDTLVVRVTAEEFGG